MSVQKVVKGIGYLGRAVLGASPQIRYEARHDLLSALSVRCGLRMYNRNLIWHTDPDYLMAWDQYPGRDVRLVHERKFNLFNMARNLKKIPGDIAECGVFKGSSAFLMLSAMAGENKYYHGFDSFEGLSEPRREDHVSNAQTFKWKKHDLAVGEEIAAGNLSSFEGQFTLYKGWIPDRFHEVDDRMFCLVHIDVDLYEPTIESLRFFWPRMSAGGMIVCDDYGSSACPGAKKAMDEIGEEVGQSVIQMTTGQGVIVKRG